MLWGKTGREVRLWPFAEEVREVGEVRTQGQSGLDSAAPRLPSLTHTRHWLHSPAVTGCKIVLLPPD